MTLRRVQLTLALLLGIVGGCGGQTGSEGASRQGTEVTEEGLKGFWNRCVEEQRQAALASGDGEAAASVAERRVTEVEVDALVVRLCEYCRETMGWGEAVNGDHCINDLKADCSEFMGDQGCL